MSKDISVYVLARGEAVRGAPWPTRRWRVSRHGPPIHGTVVTRRVGWSAAGIAQMVATAWVGRSATVSCRRRVSPAGARGDASRGDVKILTSCDTAVLWFAKPRKPPSVLPVNAKSGPSWMKEGFSAPMSQQNVKTRGCQIADVPPGTLRDTGCPPPGSSTKKHRVRDPVYVRQIAQTNTRVSDRFVFPRVWTIGGRNVPPKCPNEVDVPRMVRQHKAVGVARKSLAP
jgi:hypothetical protein